MQTLSPWRKSSYSGEGANCVEVAGDWRKSTKSGNGGEQCVEVGTAIASVAVRDTTNRDGGTLRFTVAAWNGLVTDVRAGKFDTL